MKLRVKDTVIVTSGAEKGLTGEILKIDRANNRVLVEGINKVTKHIRPSQSDPEGGLQSTEAFINASNVAYYDSKNKKGVKLGYRFEDGKKVRYNKATGETLKD